MTDDSSKPRQEPPAVQRLEDMVRGWFVGDFTPSVVRTAAVEVAIQTYGQGHAEP